MEIAIFHNFMDNIGGAEIATLIMARELEADIYTTNVNPEMIKKIGFNIDNITSIGSVPINAPFRQQMTQIKFRQLNLKKQYDRYIISGDWALSAAVNHKPNLWYIYSPSRELWDLYKYTRKNSVWLFTRLPFDIWVVYNRMLSKKYCKHVNKFVSTSHNVGGRVKKFLKNDSEIIHPPVETSKFKYKESGDYWMSVNRLISHKRVDMQIEAFKKMPKEKLIIVGSYEKSNHFVEYANMINSNKPKNVEVLSWIGEEELIDLYARCKGFITTSIDEDFGLTPIEAMASGKPVIAPNEGGYKETIIDGATGILIKDINANKIVEAIKKVGKYPEKYKMASIKQAAKFDTKNFSKNIKKYL